MRQRIGRSMGQKEGHECTSATNVIHAKDVVARLQVAAAVADCRGTGLSSALASQTQRLRGRTRPALAVSLPLMPWPPQLHLCERQLSRASAHDRWNLDRPRHAAATAAAATAATRRLLLWCIHLLRSWRREWSLHGWTARDHLRQLVAEARIPRNVRLALKFKGSRTGRQAADTKAHGPVSGGWTESLRLAVCYNHPAAKDTWLRCWQRPTSFRSATQRSPLALLLAVPSLSDPLWM